MEGTKKKETEHLSKHLKKLQKEKEALESEEKEVLKDEEEEEMQLFRSYQIMENMWAACGPRDNEIKRLLEEKQERMNSFRKKKEEFIEEFQAEKQKEYQRIETEEEEKYQSIKKFQNEENNN